MLHYIVAFLLLSGPVACSGQSAKNKKEAPAFIRTYGGDPYMGTVQVDIIRPDGSYASTDYGEGSAYFVDSGRGKAKLVVFGAIKDKKGDAGFTIDGIYQEKTWKGKSDSVLLEIGETGKLTGTAASYPQQFQFTGSITNVRLELQTRVKMLQRTTGGHPPGTTFLFRYVLRRDVNSQPAAKKKCNRIVWRTQYVANFDGSATIVRIPECVSE